MIKDSDDAGSGQRMTIEIEQATYKRLFGHAVSFDDNPDSVLNRVLDAHERNGRGPVGYAVLPVDTTDSVLNRTLDTRGQDGGESTAPCARQKAERRIDPRALPNLTHTKVLEAVIDGAPIPRPNWKNVLKALLHRAMGRAGSFGELHRSCQGTVPIVEGRKTDGGFGYIPALGVSIQGQNAQDVCIALVTVAQALGIAIDVSFMWRGKKEAAFPGERARLRIAGMGDGAVGEKVFDPGSRVGPQAQAAAPADQAVNGGDSTDTRRRRPGTALQRMLALMKRADGVTCAEVCDDRERHSGHRPHEHTIRSQVSKLMREGYPIETRYGRAGRKCTWHLASEPAPKPAPGPTSMR